jgi:hypothetical protein
MCNKSEEWSFRVIFIIEHHIKRIKQSPFQCSLNALIVYICLAWNYEFIYVVLSCNFLWDDGLVCACWRYTYVQKCIQASHKVSSVERRGLILFVSAGPFRPRWTWRGVIYIVIVDVIITYKHDVYNF